MNEPDDEKLWAAVADGSRRRVIDALLVAGETTQSALARQMPFTRQALAKHLAILEDVGIVTRTKQGREMHYRLELTQLDVASQALANIAQTWDQRMAGIRRIAESAYKQRQAQHSENQFHE